MAEYMIYVISGIVGVIVGRYCFQRNTKNRSRRNRTESSILNTLLHSPMRQQRSIGFTSILRKIYKTSPAFPNDWDYIEHEPDSAVCCPAVAVCVRKLRLMRR